MTATPTDRGEPQDGSGRIPLRMRLKAWWAGEELLVRRKAAAAADSGSDSPTGAQQIELPPDRWDATRIRLVQDVWGKGHAAPGGDSYLVRLVKPLGLNPSMSACHLGAGLGGAGRALAEAFGVWVTGLEASRELAAAGMALSEQAGMAKKAAVHHIEIESYEFNENTIDALISKEALFEVADRERLLRQAVSGLKQRGQILITDYVRAEDADGGALRAWAQAEPARPELWTLAEYQRLLTELKLDIRIAEDITAQVREQIMEGWSNFLSSAERETLQGYAAVLVDETELWNRRVAEIDAGRLQICRLHALRVPGKMLSEW